MVRNMFHNLCSVHWSCIPVGLHTYADPPLVRSLLQQSCNLQHVCSQLACFVKTRWENRRFFSSELSLVGKWEAGVASADFALLDASSRPTRRQQRKHNLKAISSARCSVENHITHAPNGIALSPEDPRSTTRTHGA